MRLWARWWSVASARSIPLRTACIQRWLLPQIVRWREPAGLPLETSVEVHLLTSQRDWWCAAWALASFVQATGSRWPMTVHDDGTLQDEARETLTALFPNLKIKDRLDADQEMESRLVRHPRCLEYRKSHPLALKLFDCAVLAGTPRLIVLDSDILFFQRPEEVLDWVQRDRLECYFNPDFQDAYCLSREEARSRLRVELWPRVNTGLSLLARSAVDVDFCEACLTDRSLLAPESIAWREQTLLALCASRFGAGGLLSDRYEVHFNPRMSDAAISRHYVGDLRPLYYAEGVWRIRRLICS